ncbi:MAG: phenylacetate-CoA oxygenase subunit PaaI [Sphingobacteriia bacterium]|nr:MAG: phenylacetate-CoA oxygenase subunit PaaI [Sphingobacteriia bacterium]
MPQNNWNTVTEALALADNALLMGQRCAEWCGHAPVLEQDIALSNLSLDFIGEARLLYQWAADQINAHPTAFPDLVQTKESLAGKAPLPTEATEDSLAYWRDVPDFKNHLITELPNGDWAQTVAKVYFFSLFQDLVFTAIAAEPGHPLQGIAQKTTKEIQYHLRWSKEWILRLGDGTAISHQKMQTAWDLVWAYLPELRNDLSEAQQKSWDQHILALQEESSLTKADTSIWSQTGKNGQHTEHLGYVLAEMQHLQRTHPNSQW